MRAGIYERKSTAQDNVPEDAKSVVHQDKRCRAFIAQRGWTVLDAHVYVDDAVSGAVFDRPGLRALLDAVERRPRPFDVLVMYAEDRLGRGVRETRYLAKRIIDNGVRGFFSGRAQRRQGRAPGAPARGVPDLGPGLPRCTACT